MRFPETIARLLPETAWQTDTVGMSRSTVLLFEDRVLKIDQDWEESRREPRSDCQKSPPPEFSPNKSPVHSLSQLLHTLHPFHDLLIGPCDAGIVFRDMGHQTAGAVLHAAGQILEIPSAAAAQRVEGAVAEKAIELIRAFRLVAGEEGAVPVLEKGEAVGRGLRLGRGDVFFFLHSRLLYRMKWNAGPEGLNPARSAYHVLRDVSSGDMLRS
jgi:hypothetical protein